MLAVSGVLDPIRHLLVLTYCFACLRGEEGINVSRSKNLMLGPCWGHVGSFFALGRLFFALGRLLRVWWAFFPHVRLFFSRFGWLRVGFSGILGQFRESETTFFGILSSAQLCKACIKIAMTFTWLVVLPCSAAVRAEHMELIDYKQRGRRHLSSSTYFDALLETLRSKCSTQI